MHVTPGKLHHVVLSTIGRGIDDSTVQVLRQGAQSLEAATTPSGAITEALFGARQLREIADDAQQRLIARGDRENMLILRPEQKDQVRDAAGLLRTLGL